MIPIFYANALHMRSQGLSCNIIEEKFPNFKKMSDGNKLKIILKSHEKERVSFIYDSWEI